MLFAGASFWSPAFANGTLDPSTSSFSDGFQPVKHLGGSEQKRKEKEIVQSQTRPTPTKGRDWKLTTCTLNNESVEVC